MQKSSAQIDSTDKKTAIVEGKQDEKNKYERLNP